MPLIQLPKLKVCPEELTKSIRRLKPTWWFVGEPEAFQTVSASLPRSKTELGGTQRRNIRIPAKV